MNSKREKETNLDAEWMILIREALDLGITETEIRAFLYTPESAWQAVNKLEK